jgi:UDP-3-O-[3-hydroxymyristoyl] glucosamine N-acyltransferase
MQKSLGEIAELIGGSVEGDEEALITGVSGIKDAKPGDITFLANPKYLPLLATTRASAIIVGRDAPAGSVNLIRTGDPYIAFIHVLRLFTVQPPPPKGIHPSALMGKNVSLGQDVALHAGVLLEDGCEVGARTIIYSGVCVGAESVIGSDCIIYPRVVISRNVCIGNNVIIHMGAVIGGFSPDTLLLYPIGESAGNMVVVEDDVEIGANVAVESSVTGPPTTIGNNTKIDNLVHIGKGARIGANCIIVSHSSIGADCVVGNGVTVAGQASILDGISVGDGTVVAARSGVSENIGPNEIVSGFPATSHEKWLRIYASMKRLPSIVKDVRDLKKRVQQMENPENEEPENH